MLQLGVAATLALSFRIASYHVNRGSEVALLPEGDVHVLNGTVPDTGGGIAATCLNGTVANYTIELGPIDSRNIRNISAQLHGVGGMGQALRGTATCSVVPEAPECWAFTWQMPNRAELMYNPLPPAPKCGSAYSEAECEGVWPVNKGACRWCTSDDKVHSLCFSAGNEPPKASWSWYQASSPFSSCRSPSLPSPMVCGCAWEGFLFLWVL